MHRKPNETKEEKLARIGAIIRLRNSQTELRRLHTKNRAAPPNLTMFQQINVQSSNLLKTTIVSFFTLVSSLSVPVFAILIQKNWYGNEKISLLEKIIVPSLFYIKIPLAISIYLAMAYSTQFKIIQLRDNLVVENINLDINNCLSQSSVSPVKISGKIICGQVMVEILKLCKLTTDTSVNITLAWAAVGLSATLYQFLHLCISSTNVSAVRADHEGLAMSYMLGKDSALELAPKEENNAEVDAHHTFSL